GYRVEDALAQLQLTDLRLRLRLCALQKHSLEDVGGFFLAGDEDARTSPGEAAESLLHVHPEGERWEARQVTDALGDILVQRDGITKTAAARMRRRSEET